METQTRGPYSHHQVVLRPDVQSMYDLVNNHDLFRIDCIQEFKGSISIFSNLLSSFPNKFGVFLQRHHILEHSKAKFIFFDAVEACLVGGLQTNLLRVFFVRFSIETDEQEIKFPDPWEETTISDVEKLFTDAKLTKIQQPLQIRHSCAIAMKIFRARQREEGSRYVIYTLKTHDKSSTSNTKSWTLKTIGLCRAILLAQTCPLILSNAAAPDMMVHVSTHACRVAARKDDDDDDDGDTRKTTRRCDSHANDGEDMQSILEEIASSILTRWPSAHRAIEFKRGAHFGKHGRTAAFQVAFLHARHTPPWTADQIHLVLKAIGYENLLGHGFLETPSGFGPTRFSDFELKLNMYDCIESYATMVSNRICVNGTVANNAIDTALTCIAETKKKEEFILFENGTVLFSKTPSSKGETATEKPKQDSSSLMHCSSNQFSSLQEMTDAVCDAYTTKLGQIFSHKPKAQLLDWSQQLNTRMREMCKESDERVPEQAAFIKEAILELLRLDNHPRKFQVLLTKESHACVGLVVDLTNLNFVAIVTFRLPETTDPEDKEALCAQALERLTKDIFFPTPLAVWKNGQITKLTPSKLQELVLLLKHSTAKQEDS